MGCKPSCAAFAAALLLTLAPAAAAPRTQAGALVERARASYQAGDHFAAVELARQALAAGPDDPSALALNAQLARDSQGPVAALPLFERAVRAAPNNSEVLGEYAATLAAAGRNRDMLRAARRLAELEPRRPRSLFLQAGLAARAGRDDLARRLLSQAFGNQPPPPAALLLTGVLELRSGSAAEAVERFDALVRRQPDNAWAQLLLARALLTTGEVNEAAARLAPLAERGDASPYLLTLTARAYEQLGRRDMAAGYLDRAARPLPPGAWAVPAGDDLPGAGPRAAVASLRKTFAAGDVSGAMSRADEMAARFPGSADVARLLGDARLLAGDNAGALASYRRAASVRSDGALVERMVAALRALGRQDEARALLARRLAQNPLERSSAVLLAQLAAEQRDWTSAARLLAYADGLGGGDAWLLAELSQAQLAAGRRNEAEATARRAHGLQRGNAGVAWVLAQALETQPRMADTLLAKAQQLAAPRELASR